MREIKEIPASLAIKFGLLLRWELDELMLNNLKYVI